MRTTVASAETPGIRSRRASSRRIRSSMSAGRPRSAIFCAQHFDIVLRRLTKFVVNRFQLLAQVIFALILIDLLAHPVFDFLFEIDDFQFTGEDDGQPFQPLQLVRLLEERLPFFRVVDEHGEHIAEMADIASRCSPHPRVHSRCCRAAWRTCRAVRGFAAPRRDSPARNPPARTSPRH